jgi:hypothetical protein
MALLNPPELRPSLVVLVVHHLASRRGAKDKSEHVLNCLAPSSLTADGKHTLDVSTNIVAALELGLLARDGDVLEASGDAVAASKAGTDALVALIRARVLAAEINTAPWGSQVGARDLTNGLAWLLGLPEDKAPHAFESGRVSVKTLQESDFGPRQQSSRNAEDGEDIAAGWPIVNPTRWLPFKRWACSLGFAWTDPLGRLIPDPTRAVRDAVPQLLRGRTEIRADEFLRDLAGLLPVIDGGDYRRHVEAQMQGTPEDTARLSQSLSLALGRLEREGYIILDDRADSDRVALFDRRTISHVRPGEVRS